MTFVERPDGTRLHLELAGDPRGEPLVLLEGMGGDLPGWRRNIPLLATELFVIAYDHRGNGHSESSDGPATMATFVEDCLAVLDDVGIERAHVYGQSFGGMVALELGLTRPERARSLILACTHAGPKHAVQSSGRAPKGAPWLAMYAPAFAAAHPEHVAEDQRVGRAQPQHPQGQRRQWEAMQDWDAFDRLPELGVPTLALHGTEDLVVDPANARVLADAIPGAELALLQGAGHLYHSEQAERSDEIVLDFVRRHPG